MAEPKSRWRDNASLTTPNAAENVLPKQCCSNFEPRESTVSGICQCWYCCYADFHLDKLNALEVGICCWPKKVMK